MCGIVGYIGTKKASPILINGLLKLEYRGYDSAGISTIEKYGISNLKNKGRVANLYDLEGINDLEGTVGIAHTRWATHGKPSKENSHPHLDNSNTFAVVHNGIIENYSELRKFLSDNDYIFLSQTDTEVIPNLIHYYFSKDTKNDDKKFLRAVNSACKDLKGSFAIEVISKLYPDVMIVARKDSPLVIGTTETENYISSDIPAILSFTKNFYLLNDNEFVEVYKDKVVFYDSDLSVINKPIKNIDWDASAAEKDGYEDFMLKEIYEQPNTVRETIGSRIKKGEKCSFDDLELSKEYLSSINKIYIVACGTAMHAGLASKKTFEELTGISVEVDIASEFRYRNPLINSKTLVIFISQSGETADTIAALKLSKSKGAKTIAVSNVIGSSITREADYTIYTHAGPEIAVASTKAYTSQVVLLDILAIHFAEILGSYDTKLEASLKLKEISYIHSDAYAAGELKHGPIALIENGITVIGILTDSNLVEKSISNIQEVITRGAKTFIITNQELNNKNFDYVLNIPNTNAFISPVLSIIPLQLFAYYISKNKGLDVDKPRNLAKSVTVE